ncbi:MAG TPA: TonB family protein [Longimicrobiaceae bacterium]|nr:TonB family protein [Longimicrobiaceae bacterium]
MKIPGSSPAMLAIGATLVLCGSASGQRHRDVRIGSFVERIHTSSVSGEWSTVHLSPRGRTRDDEGQFLWGCAGTGALVFGIRRPETATSYTETQDMVWTFDADAPATSRIRRLMGSRSWGPAAEEAAAFTARAKTAARLVILLPAASGRDVVYEYNLAGADSALNRLPCIRNPGAVREPAYTAPPRLPPDPQDSSTYELSMVEELPGLNNASALSRTLASNYPPALRAEHVSGEVQVRFRVLEDGSVDPDSVSIVSSTHEEFNEPTMRSVLILRFRPARIGGRPVKVWIVLPIAWRVS